MLTTDLALRVDPIYDEIGRRFLEHPDQFAEAFAQGLVQAAAPRHGPGLALPRPVGAGAAAVAGPGSAGRPRADRGRRHRRPQGDDPRLRPDDPAAGVDRVGVGGQLPQHRLPRRGQRRADPPRAAAELGGQRAGRARQVLPVLEQIQQAFNVSQAGRKVSLADLIVLGGCAAVEQAARERRPRRSPCRSRPGARTPRRSRRTSRRSRCSSRPPTGSATTRGPARSCRWRSGWLDRAYLLSLTAPEAAVLVGGLRALEANAGADPARRLHRPAGHADERLLREPARHLHGVEAVRPRRTSTRGGTAPRAT